MYFPNPHKGRVFALVVHKIDTGYTTKPIKQQLRGFRFWQEKKLPVKFRNCSRYKLFSLCDGEWAAKVLLVRKKDKTRTLFVDERLSDSITVKDGHPVGNIGKYVEFTT